ARRARLIVAALSVFRRTNVAQQRLYMSAQRFLVGCKREIHGLSDLLVQFCQLENPFCALVHGVVHEFAVHRDRRGGTAPPHRLELGDHAPVIEDLAFGHGVGLPHRRDLLWMDDAAAHEAQARGKPRVLDEPLLVAEIAEYAVERIEPAIGARVEHHFRSRVAQLGALDRPATTQIVLQIASPRGTWPGSRLCWGVRGPPAAPGPDAGGGVRQYNIVRWLLVCSVLTGALPPFWGECPRRSRKTSASYISCALSPSEINIALRPGRTTAARS